MKRITVFSVFVACLLISSALGETFDYDFDGVLSEHFAPIFPNPNSSISSVMIVPSGRRRTSVALTPMFTKAPSVLF